MNSQSDSDIQIEINKIKISIERETSSYIEGTIIEINKDGEMEVINPNLSISKLNGPLEEQIQTLIDGPVYLELFVKVVRDWRSKPNQLKELGYLKSA